MGQYLGVIYPPVRQPNNPSMDKYERRRLRVLDLVREMYQGKQSRFAEEIGRDPNYVSRMLYPEGKKGRKRIGEDMRDEIERKCGLPGGWLDMDTGAPARLAEPSPVAYVAPAWPFSGVSPAQWRDLTDTERDVVERVALAILGRTRHRRRDEHAEAAH